MNIFVGVTDDAWYRYLSARNFDEINFWRPRDQKMFKSLVEGEPFLFKLKKPSDAIVGVAFFTAFRMLPIRMAWDAFQDANGALDYSSFTKSLGRLPDKTSDVPLDREIGCIILSNPVFFDRSNWVDTPEDWSPNVVQGKTYTTSSSAGANLWREVEQRLRNPISSGVSSNLILLKESNLGRTYGEPYLAKRRLGQGLFRMMTLENYSRRCCITGESTLPVIEAAHICPVSKGGEHKLDNGLAMRSDMHILYDQGLITVDPDYKIRVSSQIKHLYHNGIAYYRHDGEDMRSLPQDQSFRPNRELLDQHFREVFVA